MQQTWGDIALFTRERHLGEKLGQRFRELMGRDTTGRRLREKDRLRMRLKAMNDTTQPVMLLYSLGRGTGEWRRGDEEQTMEAS